MIAGAPGTFFYEYPLMAAASIVAFGVIFKLLWGLHRFLDRMGGSVDYIEKEMRFNGGATLRDQSARIEVKVTDLSAQLEHHLVASSEDRADLRKRIDHLDRSGDARSVETTRRSDISDAESSRRFDRLDEQHDSPERR